MMKKTIYLLGMVLALGFSSCSKDDDPGVDCVAVLNELTAAASAYADAQTTENCNAYKISIQSYLDGGCFADDAQKADFQASIDALDCTN